MAFVFFPTENKLKLIGKMNKLCNGETMETDLETGRGMRRKKPQKMSFSSSASSSESEESEEEYQKKKERVSLGFSIFFNRFHQFENCCVVHVYSLVMQSSRKCR